MLRYFISLLLITAYPLVFSQKKPVAVIHFQGSSAELSMEAADSLTRLLNSIKNIPEGYRLEIVGHTDDQGDSLSNMRLSEKRAYAVADFLFQKGWKTQQMTLGVFGENEPIASNKNEKGKAQNRRVEIFFTPETGLRETPVTLSEKNPEMTFLLEGGAQIHFPFSAFSSFGEMRIDTAFIPAGELQRTFSCPILPPAMENEAFLQSGILLLRFTRRMEELAYSEKAFEVMIPLEDSLIQPLVFKSTLHNGQWIWKKNNLPCERMNSGGKWYYRFSTLEPGAYCLGTITSEIREKTEIRFISKRTHIREVYVKSVDNNFSQVQKYSADGNLNTENEYLISLPDKTKNSVYVLFTRDGYEMISEISISALRKKRKGNTILIRKRDLKNATVLSPCPVLLRATI